MPSALLLPRLAPIVASAVLHASVGAAVLVSRSGHIAGPVVTTTLDLDDIEVERPPQDAPPPEVPATARAEHAPAHQHDYPVDRGHDLRPHDPGLRHPPPSREVIAPVAVSSSPAREASSNDESRSSATAAVRPRFEIGVPGTGTGRKMPAAADGAPGDNVGHVPSTEPTWAAEAVDVPARVLQTVTARYPEGARADDKEGDVALEIVVDTHGRVSAARVVRGGSDGFGEAAVAAVRSYRFSPARRADRVVAVRMPWAVQFRLR